MKWAITSLVSLITFMSGISSAIVAPAGTVIAINVIIGGSFQKQIFFPNIQLAYAIGPLVLAPLFEVYECSLILQLANVFFLIFNLANCFAKNEGKLMAFRFLSGLGACASLTISGGLLSDLWRAEDNDLAIGLHT